MHMEDVLLKHSASGIKSCSIHQSSLFSAASCCMKAEDDNLCFYNLAFVCEQGWPGLGWVAARGHSAQNHEFSELA